MSTVAIVTDSTAYLPDALVVEHHIDVVPVQVVVAGIPYDEGTEISPSEVAEALRQWKIVSTARPGPHLFTAAYERAAERGATEVVSIHLSAGMSATYDSAVIAARSASIPVRVVDSRTVAMAMGFPVLAAAAAAEAGAEGVEVEKIARERADSSCALFYVDTLEFLRRGGRIGAAQALLGQALAVKPLLTVVDGMVTPLEKVRDVVARPRAAGGADGRSGRRPASSTWPCTTSTLKSGRPRWPSGCRPGCPTPR